MNNDTEKARIQSALILTGILLLIVKTEYYWKQVVGLTPFVIKISIAIIVLAVAAMFVVSIVRIYISRALLNVRMLLPVCIYLLAFIFSFADPFNLNAESFQSSVVLKGHYKAIINSATITFRHNGRVEYEGAGFLGYSFFYKGTWLQNGDTITTLFGEDAPIPWGKQLIIDTESQLLLPLDSISLDRQFPGFLLDNYNNGRTDKALSL